MATLEELKVLLVSLQEEVTALKGMMDPAVKVASALITSFSPPAGKGKKGRKVREKKTCLPAKTGVIRFHETKDERTGYLSTYYKAPFALDGFEWRTIEHYVQAMQYIKSDPDYAEEIRTTERSMIAHSMGKRKDRDADYDSLACMKKALQAKFEAHEDLAERLLNTGDAVLEKAAANDPFWGIGTDGLGKNHLGTLLMEIRAELLTRVEE